MTTDLSHLLGEELAGYRLEELLGQGGMAAVFRGVNTLDATIGRAIKVVLPEQAGREEFVVRFAEEARILERLTHPNIVGFYGVRRVRDMLVMELELLEGRTLGDLPRRGADGTPAGLSPTTVLGWLLQAAEGVAVAHDMGVVHRDLKPDNLYLTDAGEVKVLDFGIARALDDADRATKATRVGFVPGSPPYLAPEVCQGAEPTPAADVYALGVTLAELIAGYHPFNPPDAKPLGTHQMMYAHVQRPMPDLRTLRQDVPAPLAELVADATAKDPSQRPANARALARAMAEALARSRASTGETLTDAPTRPSLTILDPVVHDAPHDADRPGVDPGQGVEAGATFDPDELEAMDVSAWSPSRRLGPAVAALLVALLAGGGGAAWWFMAGPGESKTQELPRATSPANGTVSLDAPSSTGAAPKLSSKAPAAAPDAQAGVMDVASEPGDGPKDARPEPTAPPSAAQDVGAAQTVEWVTVTIDSRPAGARVREVGGEQRKGTTPMTIRWVRGEPAPKFRLSKARHKGRTVTLDPADDGGTQTVRLRYDRLKIQ